MSPDLIAELNQSGRSTRRRAPAGRRGAGPPAAARPGPVSPGQTAALAAAGSAADAGAARRRRGRADTEPKRTGTLPRSVLGWAVPVVAFGAAFLVGSATRPTTPAPAQLAPAVGAAGGTPTVASLASLPKPANLAKGRPAHKTKPKTKPTTTAATTAHPAATVHPVYRPVYRAPAPVVTSAPTTSTNATKTSTTSGNPGGSSVTTTSANGTGTSSGSG